MPTSASCRALFLTAPASGQGKTTLSAGLARLCKQQGLKVKVFKCGPDYLDPQILAQASGDAVEPLDLWMAGEEYCSQRFYLAAQDADLILVEGAMGMFDGSPSSADLAAQFNIPMLLLMSVSAMAQTAGAIANGLVNHRSDINTVGLIANNCASQYHQSLVEEHLSDSLPLWAALKNDPDIRLPERHLGLVQAEEIQNELEVCIEKAAANLAATDILSFIDKLPETEFFPAENQQQFDYPQSLAGKTVAVAKDQAFSFIYQANLDVLTAMGAEIKFFSPIKNEPLPECDGLWLPGGYPELHLSALANNTEARQSITEFIEAGGATLAECGGFMVCLDEIIELDGTSHPMLGLLSGQGRMRERGGCQGMQSAPLPEGEIRGHSHHRSISENTAEPIAYGKRQRHPAPGEEIYRYKNLTASYLHLFFPSNAAAIGQIFNTSS